MALLHLWAVLVLLTAEPKWIDAAEVYTNAWAVQINGGPEEADRIAREHGFTNHGNVSSAYSVCVSACDCMSLYTQNKLYIILCATVSIYSYGL